MGHRTFNSVFASGTRGRIDPPRKPKQKKTHSPGFSGRAYHRSSKASRREDLQVEEPILCWDCSSFHFHPALPGMLSTTLIRHQVVQVREPCEKRLLTATWMVKSFHREQFPLDSVMGLIQQGAGGWHLGVFKDRIPAGLLVLKPASHALTVGRPCRGGDTVGKVAEPLAQRKHP